MTNKICPSCGKEQDAQNKFCKNCGTLLSNDDRNNNDNTQDAIFEDFIKEEKDYSDTFINDDDNKSENQSNSNSKNVKICPVCKSKVETGNYCMHCGTKVNLLVKRCLNCGSMISSTARVCPKCGYNIMQKEPMLAAGLSFILPGAGQIYNGQKQKGTMLIFSIIVSLILTVIAIGVITGLIIWMYAIYDAFMSAKAIDRGEPVKDKLF